DILKQYFKFDKSNYTGNYKGKKELSENRSFT
ncbi:unnamed protein product, partial [marine sediment metagenome]